MWPKMSIESWVMFGMTKSVVIIYKAAEWVGAEAAAIPWLYTLGIVSFALAKWAHLYNRGVPEPKREPPLVEYEEDDDDEEVIVLRSIDDELEEEAYTTMVRSRTWHAA